MGLIAASRNSLACPDRSPWSFPRPIAALTCSWPRAEPPKKALDQARALDQVCIPSPRTALVSLVSIRHRLTPQAGLDAVDVAAVAEGAVAASLSGRATAAAFTICKAAAFTRWASAVAAR